MNDAIADLMLREAAPMSSIDIPFTSPILVLDPHVCGELIEHRKERLAYRHDEVWEGTYVMSPDPNNEHQFYVGRLTSIFDQIVEPLGGIVYPGANVTDRETDWTSNFRSPDVVVVLPGSKARDIGSAILGGPDFLVEIVSPYDKTRDKLAFYSKIGVRELLIVDRDPLELELYDLFENELRSPGQATAENRAILSSKVLSITFSVRGDKKPQIMIRGTGTQSGEWSI
jgi:Uma2 family endonuclease